MRHTLRVIEKRRSQIRMKIIKKYYKYLHLSKSFVFGGGVAATIKVNVRNKKEEKEEEKL